MRKELEDLVNELSQFAQTTGSMQLEHPVSKAFTVPALGQNLRNIFNGIKSTSGIETLALDANKGGTTYSIVTKTDKQKFETEGYVFDEMIEKTAGTKSEEPEDLLIFRAQAMLYVIAALAGMEDIDGKLKEENTKEALTHNLDKLVLFLAGKIEQTEEKTVYKNLTVLSNFLDEAGIYITENKLKKLDDESEKKSGQREQRSERRVRFADKETIFRYVDSEPINPNANIEEFNPTGESVFDAALKGNLNLGNRNEPVKEHTTKELQDMHRERRLMRYNKSVGTRVDTNSTELNTPVDNTPPLKSEAQSVDNTPPQKKTETPARRGHSRRTTIGSTAQMMGIIPSDPSEKSSSPLPTEKKLSNPPSTETANLDKEKRDKQPISSASKQEETQMPNEPNKTISGPSGPKT